MAAHHHRKALWSLVVCLGLPAGARFDAAAKKRRPSRASRRWPRGPPIVESVVGGPDATLQPAFDAAPPWLGADCATSVPLADGRHVWIFQDTFLGSIDAETGTRDWHCMPHNSVGTWDLPTTTIASSSLRHFVDNATCAPWLAPLAPDRWYWTETGTASSRGDRFYVFSQVMTSPCDIGCTQVGIALSAFDVSSDEEEEDDDDDDPTRWPLVANVLLPGFAAGLVWPTALVPDWNDDTVFLLGQHNAKAIAARVPRATLELATYSEAAWNETLEFYAWPNASKAGDPAWRAMPDGTGVAGLTLASIFDDAPPETSLERFQGYWIVLDIPFQEPHVQARFLAGDLPGRDAWSDPETLYTIPEPWCCTHAFSYSPKLHQEFATHANELVFTFMSNSVNESNVQEDLRLYVPQLIRLNLTLRTPPPVGAVEQTHGIVIDDSEIVAE